MKVNGIMKVNSIRKMVLLGVNSVVIVLLIVTGVTSYYTAQHEMDEVFDAQLAQYARLIDQFIASSPPVPQEKLPVVVGMPHFVEDGIERTSAEERRLEGHKYEEKLAFQVWSSSGQLILRSKNADSVSLIPHTPGYHEITYNQRHWIFYCVHNPSTSNWISTGQRDDVRGELSLYLAMDQLIPLGISLIPVTIFIWLAVNWGLKPIRRLSKALGTAKAPTFSPLDLQLPLELKPFQNAINQLLDDLESYLEKEKRFIANASHELRTPLSILLVHADNIKAAKSKPEIEAAADAILISTRRLSHLVSQLMEMDKLESVRELQTSTINLQQLINDSLANIEVSALNNVIWSLDINPSIEIIGSYNLLQAAFRNLLDNATKYSKPQTHVNVSARVVENKIILVIENHIQPDTLIDPARLGERFYRHPRNQKIRGAGLGLSIVKKIITLHHATITYTTTDKNTLIATIEFDASLLQ